VTDSHRSADFDYKQQIASDARKRVERVSAMTTMAPPLNGPQFSAETISGITGSISIACWLVVFSPQIIENFRRRSGDGLSLSFLVIWLAGDVFNVLGAMLQHVLPTMLTLAVYCISLDVREGVNGRYASGCDFDCAGVVL
jgi:hypothetical protein